MSLESARRLGLISSLITVILPVVFVPLVIIYTIYNAISQLSSGSSTFNSSFQLVLYAAVGIVAFASFIMFLLSMRRLSKYYNEPSIFKNTLYGFIITIIGSAIAYTIELVFFQSVFASISQTSNTVATAPPISSAISTLLIAGIVVLAIVFVFAIISAIFYMLAFNKLAEKSGIGNFRTAGLLMLIGFVLVIVLVGALLVWIAWILVAMSFYSLKPKENPNLQASSPSSTVASVAQKKYCPYCGTENLTEAIYCKNCGKPLQ